MPRLIYSLHLDCERVPGEPITAFVVQLDREGHGVAGGIRPIGKARVVDLRVGDWFLHRPSGKKYKLTGIVAYRQHKLTDEQVAAGDIPKDGYLVPK
jgi:hypothetical protein